MEANKYPKKVMGFRPILSENFIKKFPGISIAPAAMNDKIASEPNWVEFNKSPFIAENKITIISLEIQVFTNKMNLSMNHR